MGNEPIVDKHQFIENGGDILILKSIMGHSNIKTTEN
jgi:site-specific recombinase XerD